jgi:hypothetical protein
MDHTLAFLRDPDPGLDLGGLMIDFILDLRHLLMHPEMRLDDKLIAIERRVDQLAPPPRADGSTGPLRR